MIQTRYCDDSTLFRTMNARVTAKHAVITVPWHSPSFFPRMTYNTA